MSMPKQCTTCRVISSGTNSPPAELSTTLSGVRVTRSLVICVCFVDRCLSFCTFSFGHCVVCSSSIYGFHLNCSYIRGYLWHRYSTTVNVLSKLIGHQLAIYRLPLWSLGIKLITLWVGNWKTNGIFIN
jgi:hypothetical protein